MVWNDGATVDPDDVSVVAGRVAVVVSADPLEDDLVYADALVPGR